MLKKIAAIVALPAVLIAIYASDRWLEVARQEAGASFRFVPLAWQVAAARLLVAALLIGLFWLVYLGRGAGRLVSAVYLICGLIIALYPPLALTFGLSLVSPLGMIVPSNTVGLAGAFVAVMGAFGLLPAPEESR
jgi:hypothetical protein